MMKVLISAWMLFIGAVVGMSCSLQAGTVTFGSGTNTFNMEFVTIGNPGNAPDNDGSGSGSVSYTYGIGKFEVSRDMIIKFNASQSLQITLADMTSFGGNGANKPASAVSWNEAARFVNWLNTSSGGFAAYKFTTGGVNDNIELWTVADTLDYDPMNPYRSKRATYVLPSEHEWYKAAYYNPISSNYSFYPYGSNTPPLAVVSGTDPNTAVYKQSYEQGPANVDQTGGLSPYGVMGLGGNIKEWLESSNDLANSGGASFKRTRGGSWGAGDYWFLAFAFSGLPSEHENNEIGFRVATMGPSTPPVPEPSMMVIGTLFGLGGLVAKRRMKK